jgi:hypothetical protein
MERKVAELAILKEEFATQEDSIIKRRGKSISESEYE